MRGESAAALIFMTLIFVVGGAVIWSLVLNYRKRELQHKERLAALEKGMPLPPLTDVQAVWSPRSYLLKGMMWLYAGIALAVFLGGIAMSTGRAPTVEERVSRARNLRYLGATEDEIKQVESDTSPQGKMPETVALLGLVPIGVGLAYLIYYRVESKHALSPRE